MITVQSQSFAVAKDSLPAALKATHISLFDGGLQGIQFTDRPALGLQAQPEASTAPYAAVTIFDQFIHLMAEK